jgi:16S rRNA (guanine1516-N2)-methyltransferase
LVLLDPMFPERRKSAISKKKMQLFQKLEAPCDDEAELLDAAFAAKPRKVIVKRPPKGPFLAGRKPSYSLTGKAVRYDCYVLPR